MLGVTSSPDIHRRQEPSLPVSPSVTGYFRCIKEWFIDWLFIN